MKKVNRDYNKTLYGFRIGDRVLLGKLDKYVVIGFARRIKSLVPSLILGEIAENEDITLNFEYYIREINTNIINDYICDEYSDIRCKTFTIIDPLGGEICLSDKQFVDIQIEVANNSQKENEEDLNEAPQQWSHYSSDGVEPILAIMKNKYTFNRANIIKYGHRAGLKEGQEVLDIQKIIDYAMFLAFEENINIQEEKIISMIKKRFAWGRKYGFVK